MKLYQTIQIYLFMAFKSFLPNRLKESFSKNRLTAVALHFGVAWIWIVPVEVAKALSKSVHITETVIKSGMRVMQKQEKSPRNTQGLWDCSGVALDFKTAFAFTDFQCNLGAFLCLGAELEATATAENTTHSPRSLSLLDAWEEKVFEKSVIQICIGLWKFQGFKASD